MSTMHLTICLLRFTYGAMEGYAALVLLFVAVTFAMLITVPDGNDPRNKMPLLMSTTLVMET